MQGVMSCVFVNDFTVLEVDLFYLYKFTDIPTVMKCLRTELLLGRSKRRLDDNIKIVLNEICGLWISFIWLRTLSQYLELVKSVIDFRGFFKRQMIS
jgi:hypothetical protein